MGSALPITAAPRPKRAISASVWLPASCGCRVSPTRGSPFFEFYTPINESASTDAFSPSPGSARTRTSG